MSIKSLSMKNVIKADDGEEFLDMLSSNIDLSNGTKMSHLFPVTEDYVGRPDLIAIRFYGSSDYVDVILAANEIFDGFTVDIDMVLYIPSKDVVDSLYVKEQVEDPASSKFTDTKRMPK